LFTLHTLLNVIICCSQLNTCGVLGLIRHKWILIHRCSWMVVYVSCCNAQSKSHSNPLIICTLSLFYQFPNCNLFTQHVLFYLMERHHYWTVDPGPISFILLSPVYFTCTVYFTRILLSLSTRYAHNLCFKQTGEIDNLIISWKQSIWLCCVQVPCCCS
jgi:hypothetical protein